MKYMNTLPIVFASALLLSCSSSSSSEDIGPGASPDAMADNNAPDAMTNPGAADAAVQSARIPDWTLEDIQTDSAMLGQTYGLDTFADKILVVVVVQGF